MARLAGSYVPGGQSNVVVSIRFFAYSEVMHATAIVKGKVVRFKLSPALARAHRENQHQAMTGQEAVALVEDRRSARARVTKKLADRRRPRG